MLYFQLIFPLKERQKSMLQNTEYDSHAYMYFSLQAATKMWITFFTVIKILISEKKYPNEVIPLNSLW